MARHPEWSLQTKIRQFVREMVDASHEFAAHDRSQNHGGKQHLWEATRGIRAGWPDVELLLPGGLTFRCELKAPGGKPSDAQTDTLARIAALGHPAAWANSVVSFLAAARAAGVPFRPAADLRALDLDLVLEGAAQKAKPPRSYKARAPRATPAAIRRTNALRARVLF